jgi:phosphinothricin acetyltransferase
MDYELRPLTAEDGPAVIDIFNHYIENSFAAYPESPVPAGFFDVLMKMTAGYPALSVKDAAGRLVGFGMLRAHHMASSFSKTAEITYFLQPDSTRQGIGSALLAALESAAKTKGITNILASISSLNEASIQFHRRHGFDEVGRFRGVGTKRGQAFDVVWMQKML